MSVDSIVASSNSIVPHAANTVAPDANTKLDREAFLKLLVAQLKYQDPSKPMDASEMISQSAQLSVVDKLDQINTILSGSAMNNQMMLAGTIIGKNVTFTSTEGLTINDTVTSARLVNGSMVLSTGEWDVPMSAVTAISAATPAPPPAAAATGSTTSSTTGTTATAPSTTAPSTTEPAS
jgi:flagellar basal-body rod modification protein FlgD